MDRRWTGRGGAAAATRIVRGERIGAQVHGNRTLAREKSSPRDAVKRERARRRAFVRRRRSYEALGVAGALLAAAWGARRARDAVRDRALGGLLARPSRYGRRPPSL